MYIPKLYLLVGVPASGKSTWITQQSWATDPNCVIASTDQFVESYAITMGKTYSEVFADYMPTALQQMTKQVTYAHIQRQTIIWDQTSTTVASRAKKLRMFATPSNRILQQRLASRPGKEIPKNVMQAMINGYVMPTIDEGFDEIRLV